MRFKRSLAIIALSLMPIFSATFNVSTALELRQALENAALNGENDTIILQPGTYSTLSDGLGTFTFNDTEEYNLSIEGADGYSMNDIVLDGNKTQQVMNFTNSKSFTLKIKNLSIVNGKTGSKGGGLYTTGSLIVKDCNISNNSASKDGSGFYSNGFTTISNSTIANNSSNYDGSGGFYSQGSTTISNSTIANNKGGNYGGSGGFYSQGSTTISNSTIANNSSNYNGGGFSSDASVVISNSTIINNKGGNYGGGFYSGGSTTISNSTVISNSCGKYFSGGGFYSGGSTTISNSTIANNKGGNYGGSGGFYSNDYLVITNSIINDNNDGFYSNNILLINSDIINNDIVSYGVFINNIFVNAGISFKSDSKLYHNYIDYSGLNENNHVIVKKSNLLPTVAGDINLADDNITLQSGSPAIDAGLNPTDDLFKNAFSEESYAKVVKYLKTDYFGNERIANSKIDIGASEYGASKFNKNKPKIIINLSSNQKVYSTITVNFNIETPNTISELYIDKGNGYESVATTLRSFTVTYDSAGEYTVKVKAVDDQDNVAEVTKSINVYDLTTQEAIEYGKKLCKEDPASCGISQNLHAQSILDNKKLTDVTVGWKLLGADKNISATDIFNKNQNINIIWAYKNGVWQAKGADSTIDNLLKKGNIPSLDILETGDGFWINVK